LNTSLAGALLDLGAKRSILADVAMNAATLLGILLIPIAGLIWDASTPYCAGTQQSTGHKATHCGAS
jgi:hypothetical protein